MIGVIERRGSHLGATILGLLGLLLLVSVGCGVMPTPAPSPDDIAANKARQLAQLQQAERGAQQGNPQAQWELGNIYLTGRYGTRADPVQARHWWELAAAQHFLRAEIGLAEAHEAGYPGFTKDAAEAMAEYQQMLLEPECQPRQIASSSLCMIASQRVEQLADRGGTNLPPNPNAARAAYLDGLRSGLWPCRRLAELYRDGIGGPVDHSKAYFFALAGFTPKTRSEFRDVLDAPTAAAIEEMERQWFAKKDRTDPFVDKSSEPSP